LLYNVEEGMVDGLCLQRVNFKRNQRWMDD